MIYLGASFLYCHRNQSSDHRDLSTEHTEDTEFFIHGGQDFLVATLEILEEIFFKNGRGPEIIYHSDRQLQHNL